MKKVIFVRVPRTASTNFTNILERIYKPNIIRDLVWQEMSAQQRTKKLGNGEYFYDFDNFKFPAKDMSKFNAIEGHFYARKYKDFYPEYDFVTFLRDPVERVISHFNIIVSRQDRLGINIKKFARIYKNFHKSLIGDDLSLYSFIGITEMFNFSVNQFYKHFEIPNNLKLNLKGRGRVRTASRRKRSVSAEERKYITELNAEDYEIYNFVKSKLVALQQKIQKQEKKRESILEEEETREQREERNKRRKLKRKKLQQERRVKIQREKREKLQQERRAKCEEERREDGKAEDITDN